MNEVIQYLTEITAEVSKADYLFVGLMILLSSMIIVLETLSRKAKAKQAVTGIKPDIRSVVTHSPENFKSREYISKIQKLAGRPDGILIENGYIIPVERKPFSNKIRDRYIAQILVYMRLIEEFEGKKPPYGYLILGKNSRKVKIFNTAARQIWLQKIIDEMHDILQGKRLATAMPQEKKCLRCSVASHCQFKPQNPSRKHN